MKRICLFLITGLILISMIGCTKDQTEKENDTKENETKQDIQDVYVVDEATWKSELDFSGKSISANIFIDGTYLNTTPRTEEEGIIYIAPNICWVKIISGKHTGSEMIEVYSNGIPTEYRLVLPDKYYISRIGDDGQIENLDIDPNVFYVKPLVEADEDIVLVTDMYTSHEDIVRRVNARGVLDTVLDEYPCFDFDSETGLYHYHKDISEQYNSKDFDFSNIDTAIDITVAFKNGKLEFIEMEAADYLLGRDWDKLTIKPFKEELVLPENIVMLGKNETLKEYSDDID